MIKRKVKYFEKKKIIRKMVNCPNQSNKALQCDGWSMVIRDNFKIGDIIEVCKDSSCNGYVYAYNWREKETSGQICSECLSDICKIIKVDKELFVI